MRQMQSSLLCAISEKSVEEAWDCFQMAFLKMCKGTGASTIYSTFHFCFLSCYVCFIWVIFFSLCGCGGAGWGYTEGVAEDSDTFYLLEYTNLYQICIRSVIDLYQSSCYFISAIL